LPIRCLIQLNLLATNETASAEDRQLGELGTLYWLGRVNAAFPRSDAVNLIPDVAMRMKPENVEQEGEYCGSELAGRISDMNRASGILKRLRQADETRAKAK
jgi:hypothetical protein